MTSLAHKIRMYPTKAQANYLLQACGISRFAYNWALETWKRKYENGEKSSAYGLKKEFNSIKKEQFPWCYEVTKTAAEQSFMDLENAFKKFFKKQNKYPRFKKRGVRDSFYLGDRFQFVNSKYVKLPKLSNPIRLAEELRLEGRVVSATISRTADRWFISVNVEITQTPFTVRESQDTVGVDLGVSALATLSTGEKIEPPRALQRWEKRLARAQRVFSRRKKGSNRRKKAAKRVAQIHYKIKCCRDDFTHKFTSYLVDNFGTIVIEDLNVKGMMKNRKLAKHIGDRCFGKIRRQLEYKCKLYNRELVLADRWFPSSKLCSVCGEKKDDLTLSDRVFVCSNCDSLIDRDYNAAVNLVNLTSTGGLPESNARGENVRPTLSLNREGGLVETRMNRGQTQVCPSS